MKWRKEWGSHLPILMKLVNMTTGPILEVGTGIFSTPYLYYACMETKRSVTAFENQPRYYGLNKQFESEWYHIHFVEDWDKMDFSGPWDIVLMDQDPGRRRVLDVPKVANCAKYILLHDSQSVREYRYDKIFPLFKYRYDYKACLPWTTVVSNLVDLSFLKERKMDLEELLMRRDSVRKYQPTPVSKEDLDKLLWAGYGKTPIGRTVPSAGACYPLKLYLVERREDFNYYDAPNYVVIAADYDKTIKRYGQRGYRYVYMEVGHIAQNITLQAITLGLTTVMIGAFDDNKVKKLLGIEEEPLYIIPVGKEAK